MNLRQFRILWLGRPWRWGMWPFGLREYVWALDLGIVRILRRRND